MDKRELELLLEKIPRYPKPLKKYEQYETPSSIASHVLWKAFLHNDVLDKRVAELGCGVGRFSIGALILGAKTALCIDVDENILVFSKHVVETLYPALSPRIIHVAGDVSDILLNSVDTVFMNPPFGVVKANRGLDMVFLRKALLTSRSIYTIHKYSKGIDRIVTRIADELGYEISHRELIDFPIPMIYETHRRKIYRFKTIFYILRKRGV